MKASVFGETMTDVQEQADHAGPVSADSASAQAGRSPTAGGPGESPKMYRRRDGRVLAGVAGGLADHLGVPILWVRATFVILAAFGWMGLFAYGAFWVSVPQQPRDEATVTKSPRQRQQGYGLLALGVGLTIAGSAVTGMFSGWSGVPIVVVLLGAAVVWREADESQRRRWRDGARSGVAEAVFGGGGWPARVRVLIGVLLVMAGIGIVVLRGSTQDNVQFALVSVLATLVGVAVLTVPFWLRLVRDLGEERRAHIRTQERAEIAAHLHDSVLQTLALIQKQSESPRQVAWLARGQERELRTWLYGPSGYGASGSEKKMVEDFSQAIAHACGEVEDRFAISVQHVVVGAAEMDEALTALVQAAREAVVNAAKHASVEEVSVYAEVEPTSVAVFVRDRGTGFDPDAVPNDRHGIADSIKGRMQRYGGTCRFRTAPGEGTEVQLEVPRTVTTRAAEGMK